MKNDVNVASKSNKQKNFENPNQDPLVRGKDPRIHVPKCHGSATPAHLPQPYLSFSMSWLEMSKEAYASWMRSEMVIFSSSLTASMASGSSRITELKYLNQRREPNHSEPYRYVLDDLHLELDKKKNTELSGTGASFYPWIRDPGWKKNRSRIRNKHPVSYIFPRA